MTPEEWAIAEFQHMDFYAAAIELEFQGEMHLDVGYAWATDKENISDATSRIAHQIRQKWGEDCDIRKMHTRKIEQDELHRAWEIAEAGVVG